MKGLLVTIATIVGVIIVINIIKPSLPASIQAYL
jgi:hypothetical protein